MSDARRVVVWGAGSWGTALALHLAKSGRLVSLWVYEAEQFESMGRTGENADFLPGLPPPEDRRDLSRPRESAGRRRDLAQRLSNPSHPGPVANHRPALPRGHAGHLGVQGVRAGHAPAAQRRHRGLRAGLVPSGGGALRAELRPRAGLRRSDDGGLGGARPGPGRGRPAPRIPPAAAGLCERGPGGRGTGGGREKCRSP